MYQKILLHLLSKCRNAWASTHKKSQKFLAFRIDLEFYYYSMVVAKIVIRFKSLSEMI